MTEGHCRSPVVVVSTIRVSGWVKTAVENYGSFFIPFAYANGTDSIAYANGSNKRSCER
jgi:hypothetical protein